ncbi:hypothetical protein [Haliangium ochraceum]|nr:hypothetical protein [Haliangium ochraceum]
MPKVLVYLVTASSIAACLSAPPSEVARKHAELHFSSSESPAQGNSLAWNRILWNSITWNRILWNQLPWETMSPAQEEWHELRVGALLTHTLQQSLDSDEMQIALTDPQVHEFFGFVVECALPFGTGLDDPNNPPAADDPDPTPAFQGLHGLAPEWSEDSGCDEVCQRAVSSCLLARVNYYGERNVLSWRGSPAINDRASHPGYASPSAPERASFHLEEGAIWGNLFLPDPEVHMCRGENSPSHISAGPVAIELYGDEVPANAVRMCADDRDCHSDVYAGRCIEICASRDSENGAYYDCTSPDGTVYAETMTVFRSDWNLHADFVEGSGLDPKMASCTNTVYQQRASCADDFDVTCVDLALEECGVRSVFDVQLLPLGTDRHTNTCTAYVCAVNNECCSWRWDGECVQAAQELCQ